MLPVRKTLESLGGSDYREEATPPAWQLFFYPRNALETLAHPPTPPPPRLDLG